MTKKSKRTYQVLVTRSGDWWAIEVPEIRGAFSQARRLDQVEDNAREIISMMLDVDAAAFDVDIETQQPQRIVDLMAALEASTKAARKAKASESEVQRKVITELREFGLPVRDVGQLLGVSHQRVSKILKEAS